MSARTHGVPIGLGLLLLVASTTFAQYTVGPSSGRFTSIAGTPGAVLLSVSNCDDCTEEIQLPFTFCWFESVETSSMRVSTNGCINVNPNQGSYSSPACCLALPLNVANVPERISIVHEDLDPSSGGDIYFLDKTTSVIVSYENVRFFSGVGLVNAQCEIYANGDVELRYGGNPLMDGITYSTGTFLDLLAQTDGQGAASFSFPGAWGPPQQLIGSFQFAVADPSAVGGMTLSGASSLTLQ